MILLKKASFAIVFALIISSTFQCSSSKVATGTFEEEPKIISESVSFEAEPKIKLRPVYFQEWYAGIKVGGTGVNVFLPVISEDKSIALDSIYFRNLTGKLVKKGDKYMATLQNRTLLYTFQKSETTKDYPFTLADNECVVSYKEQGVTKYFKIAGLDEVAGAYYENGPTSIYAADTSSAMATVEDEDND